MKKHLLFVLLLLSSITFSQVKLLSWNLENFGKSKSDETIVFIDNIVRNFDIVAIQEVVAGYGGAQAVARLADELNRKGAKWEYAISDPTTSSANKTERYAFLWKPSSVKLKGKPWLEQQYNLEIDREPYFATFEKDGKTVTIATFHAITKSKQPETEIKYFKFLPQEYPTLELVFAGDFNCPQSHTVFNPLKKMGYQSVFVNQKTSLKHDCFEENCLASEFDNLFFNASKIKVKNFGVILFYKSFDSLQEARKISDHIPIWAEIVLN